MGTTKNVVHMCCQSILWLILQVTERPTHKKSVQHSLYRNQYTLFYDFKTSDRNHHDFLHLYQYHRKLYLDMFHDTDKNAKLRVTPS
jgi:hypothetical protein